MNCDDCWWDSRTIPAVGVVALGRGIVHLTVGIRDVSSCRKVKDCDERDTIPMPLR